MNIENIIQDRYHTINKYAELANVYFKYVSNIIEGTDVQEFRKTQAVLKYLESVEAPSVKLTLRDINAIWNNLQSIYGSMDDLEKLMVGSYSDKAIFSMSQSAGVEFKLLRGTLMATRERMMDKIKTQDAEIFQQLFPTFNRGDCTEFLLIDNSVNSFTTALMIYLMTGGTGADRDRLRRLVEQRKDGVLGSKHVQLVGNAMEAIPLMPYVPVTNLMPISELMPLIGCGRNLTGDVFSEAADDLNAGFTVLHRGYKTTMAFDLRGIISPEFVRPLVTKPAYGLTKKFIKRFTTATTYGTRLTGGIVKYAPSGPSTPTKFYLLETFSDPSVPNQDKQYRILSKSFETYHLDAAPHLDIVTTRPDDYNGIMSQQILTKYLDPTAESLLGNVEEFKRGKSSEPIKNKVLNAFMAYFDAVNPTTYDEFKAIFTSWDDLDTVLIEAMFHMVGKQPTPEMLLTYLAKIDDIGRVFTEELASTFDDSGISREMFVNLSKTDLQKQLRDAAKYIVTTAANQLDQGEQWTKYSLSLKEYFIDKKFENV